MNELMNFTDKQTKRNKYGPNGLKLQTHETRSSSNCNQNHPLKKYKRVSQPKMI